MYALNRPTIGEVVFSVSDWSMMNMSMIVARMAYTKVGTARIIAIAKSTLASTIWILPSNGWSNMLPVVSSKSNRNPHEPAIVYSVTETVSAIRNTMDIPRFTDLAPSLQSTRDL